MTVRVINVSARSVHSVSAACMVRIPSRPGVSDIFFAPFSRTDGGLSLACSNVYVYLLYIAVRAITLMTMNINDVCLQGPDCP